MKTWTVAAILILVTGAVSLVRADWPSYRGVDGAATADIKAAPSTLSAESLKEIWTAPLGDSFGQVAVAGDKAVAFIKRDGGEAAICLDAKTGKELWVTPIDKTIADKQGGDGPRTTPAIDGEHVYIYSTYLKLACLDINTGKAVWQHDLVAEAGGNVLQWGNAASPVVEGDVVIVIGGGKGKGIMAFDKGTGKAAWATTNDAPTHATPTPTTILGQRQVICFMQSGLVSVDPANGHVLWTFQHPYRISTAASPVVGGKNGDIVYCSAGYGVGAAACRISKSGDGWAATKLWRTEGKNLSHWSTPVHHDGYIYGLFGHNDGKAPLACIDIETGDMKWNQKGFGSQGGLILLGDKLLVQTPPGDLVLVEASPEGYKELGRVNEFKGKNWTAPAYSNGRIYARNTVEGKCLELK